MKSKLDNAQGRYELPCGKRQTKTSATNSLQGLSTSDLRAIIAKYVTMPSSTLASMKREQLCDTIMSYQNKPKSTTSSSDKRIANKLKYDGSNSCYIDTLLVAFFHLGRENKWALRHIFNKKTLSDSAKELRSAIIQAIYNDNQGTCTMVRQVLHKHVPGIEWLHTQNDPVEVVNALLNIFQVPDDVTIKIRKNKPQKTNIMAMMVPKEALLAHKKLYIQDYFPTNPYTDITVLKAKLLYVAVERNFMDTRKLMSSVVPAETLDMPDKKQLRLWSIVIHNGSNPTSGHYTCLINMQEHGNKWYYYDDMNEHMSYVADTLNETLLKMPSVLKNCAGFVYHVL